MTSRWPSPSQSPKLSEVPLLTTPVGSTDTYRVKPSAPLTTPLLRKIELSPVGALYHMTSVRPSPSKSPKKSDVPLLMAPVGNADAYCVKLRVPLTTPLLMKIELLPVERSY